LERGCVVGVASRSGRSGQFGEGSQDFPHRSDSARFAAVGKACQVVTQPEPEQAIADELAGGQAAALFLRELPGPEHQLAGDHLRHGVVVGDGLGEDVPDGDEEFAGDGDVGVLAAGEASELLFPVGGLLDGDPSRFDECAAQVAATLFGDASGAMGLAGVVDAGTESGVGDEVLW